MTGGKKSMLPHTLIGSLLGLGLMATAASAATTTMFGAVYISGSANGDALTPDFVNNQVASNGSGTYMAPTAVFGTGNVDPSNNHIAYRVATDGLAAVPTDLLHNTNRLIAPGGGESIDYEAGNGITGVTVTGAGTVVAHTAFNNIDNSVIGGRRRLVANFDTRGASYNYGGLLYPVIDHIGWQFTTGATDMATAAQDLQVSLRDSGGGKLQSIPTYPGTSSPYALYIQRGTTYSINLTTDAAFNQTWKITGLGFAASRAASADLNAILSLSDGTTTTVDITPTDQGYFQTHTAGDPNAPFGTVFAGLDVSGVLHVGSQVSITGVTFVQGPGRSAYDGAVDDLAIVLSPVLVPEPTSLGMGLLGLGGILMMPKLRRQRA